MGLNFNFFSGSKGRKEENTSLSFESLVALNKIDRFFSDRVEDAALREKVRAIGVEAPVFATDILGDPNPSFEDGMAVSCRIQATKTGKDCWQIHKILYLDLPPGSRFSELNETGQPVLIGAAKSDFDALQFCVAFQEMAKRDGKKIMEDKNRAMGRFTHWRMAAAEAGQPVDIDGALIPCALGVPVLPSDSNRRFDKEQLLIMAKTAPEKPRLLERVFEQKAEEKEEEKAVPPVVPDLPKMLEVKRTVLGTPPKPVTWKDIGRSNPDFFSSNNAPIDFSNIGIEAKADNLCLGNRDFFAEVRKDVFAEKTIKPDDYLVPPLPENSFLDRLKRQLQDARVEGKGASIEISRSIVCSYKPLAMQRREGNYDILGILEIKGEFVDRLNGGWKARQFLGLTKDIENISRDAALRLIENFDYNAQKLAEEQAIRTAERTAEDARRKAEEELRLAQIVAEKEAREKAVQDRAAAQAAAEAAAVAKEKAWKNSFFGK